MPLLVPLVVCGITFVDANVAGEAMMRDGVWPPCIIQSRLQQIRSAAFFDLPDLSLGQTIGLRNAWSRGRRRPTHSLGGLCDGREVVGMELLDFSPFRALEISHCLQRIFVGQGRFWMTFNPFCGPVKHDERISGVGEEFISLVVPIGTIDERIPRDLVAKMSRGRTQCQLAAPSGAPLSLATNADWAVRVVFPMIEHVR